MKFGMVRCFMYSLLWYKEIAYSFCLDRIARTAHHTKSSAVGIKQVTSRVGIVMMLMWCIKLTAPEGEISKQERTNIQKEINMKPKGITNQEQTLVFVYVRVWYVCQYVCVCLCMCECVRDYGACVCACVGV